MIGRMEENLKGNGKIIICMEKVFTLGRMVENMKEIITWIKNMDLVYIDGQMEEYTRVHGLMGNSMAKEFINCLINKLKKEYGKMAKELNGLNNNVNCFFNINKY